MRGGRIIIVGLLLLGAGAASVLLREAEQGLPTFVEPGPGPRAPEPRFLGLGLGTASFAEVRAWIAARNLSCKDTSARALIAARRRARQRGDEARRPQSEELDAATAASSKVSPMERNPQIRWSCEGTPAAALADRTRPDVDGRLLFIFDSPDHPLRHVSFRRVHQDPARAGQDLASTLAAIEARHGAPSKAQGELPAQREGGPLFEKWSLIEREWRYADLVVTATALDFGERGVDVYEAVEVPYPVRSDAPATAGTAPLDPAANL